MKEIVEKHQNKGLTDLVHVDSFLSYIEGEAVLQQMIVTSVDQSVLGGARIPPGWDRASLRQYLTNNTPHLVTVAVFLLLLVTGLIVRGLQFRGGSGRGSEEFLLMLVIGRCENTIWRQEPSAHDRSSLWTRN